MSDDTRFFVTAAVVVGAFFLGNKIGRNDGYKKARMEERIHQMRQNTREMDLQLQIMEQQLRTAIDQKDTGE